MEVDENREGIIEERNQLLKNCMDNRIFEGLFDEFAFVDEYNLADVLREMEDLCGGTERSEMEDFL